MSAEVALSKPLPESLNEMRAKAMPLAEPMTAAGYSLYLVGGAVRDSLLDLGGKGGDDIDCTTDARPEQILSVVEPVASTTWTTGQAFGTIGCVISGQAYEVTTYRADSYEPNSRKPIVEFGTNIEDDLFRRDFTVNAIACDIGSGELVDPCGGQADLRDKVLRTPLEPEVSFADDPLRMLRAARFAARYELTPSVELVAAATEMRDRLSIVSAERVFAELDKLMKLEKPESGFSFLAKTGLMVQVIPEFGTVGHDWGLEVSQVSTAIAQMVSANQDYTQRWAALFQGMEVSTAAFRMQEMRLPTELIKDIATLTAATERLKQAFETVSNERRFIHEFGRVAKQALQFQATNNAIFRQMVEAADKNLEPFRHVAEAWEKMMEPARQAAEVVDKGLESFRQAAEVVDKGLESFTQVAQTGDKSLESVRQVVSQTEIGKKLGQELEQVSLNLGVAVSGEDVMEAVGIEAGPKVGEALDYLQELVYENGPMSREEALKALEDWEG